jgi:hypothetical protein
LVRILFQRVSEGMSAVSDALQKEARQDPCKSCRATTDVVTLIGRYRVQSLFFLPISRVSSSSLPSEDSL